MFTSLVTLALILPFSSASLSYRTWALTSDFLIGSGHLGNARQLMSFWKIDMRRCRAHGTTKSPNGYALLLVMFFVALLLVTLGAARPNLITEDRREKEVEMIWRGKQYVRGIRLYYQKVHHYPTQLDDLYKPKTGMRFMRQSYKDPMNTADGTWRIINAGPAGQIVGSLTQPTNPLISGTNPANGLGDPLAASSSSSFGGIKDPFATPSGTSSPSSSGVTPTNCQASLSSSTKSIDAPDAGGPPSIQAAQCSNTPPPATNAPNPNSVPVQNAIIGVGSKIDKRSIIWLEGQKKNYLHFEFIWKVVTANPATVTPNP